MTDAFESARRAMRATGQWGPGQHMGRRWPVGCVALEVTQRCNLDCTLCYLSESSEAIKDLPLEELFRRIGRIRAQDGPGVDVQITGGEPTLRRREELAAIVQHARGAELRTTLFTNGIRADRGLLAELAAAGLEAVAFHVDTTQQRKGYQSESDLNVLRDDYIARAYGLPLAVYFNTTVHDGNFGELPALVRFFVARAGALGLASFQLQAETGRGVLGRRAARITPESVAAQIRAGAGAPLAFDVFQLGHVRCNRLALGLVANGRMHDLLDEPDFMRWALAETAQLRFERARPGATLRALAAWALRRPRSLARCLAWIARKAWRMKGDVFAARGRIHKLSFFIHNFMDACHLEQERLDACVFTVAGAEAQISMCAHNARRDEHLLRPVAVRAGYWDPASGRTHALPQVQPIRLTRKTARGRARPAA
jgi:hypothetical protein